MPDELLAYLLQQEEGSTAELRCVELICGFFRGKHGDTPTKTDTTEADRIDIAYARCAEKEATGAAPPTSINASNSFKKFIAVSMG